MSLRSYICWVAINIIGLAYFAVFIWVLFNPHSSLQKMLLFLHLVLVGALLGIFFTAIAYIKWNTPALSHPIWHGIGCQEASTMPIDMSIQLINRGIPAYHPDA